MLAYPLWFQFAGPQGVADGMFSPHYFSADLAAGGRSPRCRVAGSDDAARLTTGPAEYNTFLGWPLLLVTAGLRGLAAAAGRWWSPAGRRRW